MKIFRNVCFKYNPTAFIFIVAIESWAQKWDRSFFSDDSNLVAKVDKGINFIRNMNSNSIRANQLSQTLQILLANLGIYPSDSTEKESISSRTYVIIILMGLHIIMSVESAIIERKFNWTNRISCYRI